MKFLLKYFYSFLFQILLVSIVVPVFSQDKDETNKEIKIEQKVETLSENAEDTQVDYTQLFDDLLFFTEHPIDLNNTTKEQLLLLNELNETQINNLFQHIEKNGKLIHICELQTVDGFDLQTIRDILPYTKVDANIDAPHISFKDIMKNGQHQFIVRDTWILEAQKGFSEIDSATYADKPNSRYLGDNQKIYSRYRFNYGTKVRWGFTGEKDPGEQFLNRQNNAVSATKSSQKMNIKNTGFDFYSAHLFLQNFGKLKALAIGDYQLQLGQGLTFWTGLAYGKSAYVMNVKRSAVGLKTATSVDENRFLRGVGSTVAIKNFEFTGFFSHKKIDANAKTISDSIVTETNTITNDYTYISSFQQDGLHRTPAEMAKRKTLGETIFGGNVAYKKRNLKIGVTAVRTLYSDTIRRKLSYYNQFDFSNTNQNFNAGVDYNYVVKNFNFFGEFSRSENGGLAFVNGVVASLDPRVAVTVLHRNYQKNYQSLNNAGFGDNALNNVNEQGIYTGIMVNPFPTISLTGFYDKFINPWMRSSTTGPSYNSDYMAQMNYTPSKKVDMYFRFRHRDKFRNSITDIEDIDIIVGTEQNNFRYNVSYKISPSFTLRNRIDFVSYKIGNAPTEKGFMMYQDIVFKPQNSSFSCAFRYALFDCESYNTRIYTYENDVLYGYSMPALYDRGTRTYITLRYGIKRRIDLWLRLSQTFYNNKTVIGKDSDLDQIQGNTKSDVRVQVRYKF